MACQCACEGGGTAIEKEIAKVLKQVQRMLQHQSIA